MTRRRPVLVTLRLLIITFVAMYAFAQYVRRTSMFFPEKYPIGDWKTSAAEVTFAAADGVRLHGWLYRAGDPLIVWCHGNGGNITSRAPMAEELAKRGVSVLLFDWRGYGKSEGSPSESKLYDDALAAYDYGSTITKDIVAYGESLGGPYAAHMATHRKVRAVIIENSFPSLRELGNALYAPIPLGWTAPRAMRTAAWLNEAKVPVLVMHGRRDEVIPFALGQRLYEELHVPKEMLISDDAGHCEIPFADSARYYAAVMNICGGGL